MTSKNYSLNNFSGNEYLAYMGLSIGEGSTTINIYVDIEIFFLWLTTQFSDSRIAEGALCWIRRYGNLLSPSKIRRLANNGVYYNQQILNGIVNFMATQNIKYNQFKILKTPKFKKTLDLGHGVRVRNPMKEFEIENVLIPNFKLDDNKFLKDEKTVLENNLELRSRMLFGACLNADIFSIIKKHPETTRYEIHKITTHHKKSINDVYSGASIAAEYF